MPANTGGGYPYPLATEPVRDGATAIQNLATAVDSRMGSFIELGKTATLAVGTGGWYTAALATGDILNERDPLSLLQADGTGVVVPVGYYDVLVQMQWANAGASTAGRRIVGFGNVTGGPTTWNQSASVCIPNAGGVQTHRGLWRNDASTRVCALAYQDSGATVNLAAVHLMIRYLSAQPTP